MRPPSPLLALVLAAGVTLALLPPARALARRWGLIDHPRPDRFHARPVPLMGGVACLAGWLAAFLFSGPLLRWVGPAGPAGADTWRFSVAAFAGAAGFLLLGLADDRRPIRPLAKGAAEGCVLLLALLLWRPRGSVAGAAGLGIAWLAGMILVNAWNYLDHADGTFAGAAAVGAAVLGLAASRHLPGSAEAILSWAVCGTMIAFLAWNLPPARVFLGDAGSLPFGFLLVLAGLGIVDRAPAIARAPAAAAHGTALADMLLVTIVRLRAGEHPFAGGRDHSGHRFSVRLGPRGAAMAVLLLSALFGLIGLLVCPRLPGVAVLLVPLASLLLALGLMRLTPPPDRLEPRPGA